MQGYAAHLEGTGLRLVLAENINDVDEARLREGVFEYREERLEEGLNERSAGLIEKWHGGSGGRVSCFMAPHAPETCSPALLRRSREMAERYGVGYTIHLSQSHDEVEAVTRVLRVAPRL